MPTRGGQVGNGQILLDVAVRLPARRGDAEPTSHVFMGLLDTGATRTMVSRKVVDDLGAPPCGVGSFVPATGKPQSAKVYLLDLAIPVVAALAPTEDPVDAVDVTVYVRGLANVPVQELPLAFPDFDVLLGMDLITQFHITLCQGVYMLSN